MQKLKIDYFHCPGYEEVLEDIITQVKMPSMQRACKEDAIIKDAERMQGGCKKESRTISLNFFYAGAIFLFFVKKCKN